MARRTSGLNIDGIILLDKRNGVSSNRALQEVRHLFKANKAGHTGSLDPLATGLLPLCFGEATKVSAFMLDEDKRYQVTVQLGMTTDTGDIEGKVLQQRTVPIYSPHELQAALSQFTGCIQQTPPMYSALKHQGKKLYELARAGLEIERQSRAITIYSLELLAYDNHCLFLDVLCSKGTYIRSLAEDIGQYLGCGATVSALRRTQVGIYQLAAAWTIEQLRVMDTDTLLNCLMAVDAPLAFMQAAELNEQQAVAVKYGQVIAFDGLSAGIVRLYHANGFLGLGEMRMDGKLAPTRLFNCH